MRLAGPRLFMGDLNVYKTDVWNPRVPCTGDDNAGRLRTISLIEGAGYTDAWKATQNSEGWTGMQSRNGCGTPSGNLFKRIDYVYSNNMRTLSTDRFGRATPGGDAPSDHVGLIAELSAVPGQCLRRSPANRSRSDRGGRRPRDGTGLRRRNGPAPLADLLPPHRVVQALLLEQLVVAPGLDDAAALEHVDPIGVHDRRQPVRDQDGDRVAAGRRRRESCRRSLPR